jgi:UDP-N-acetylglucosamine 2-epimerase
MSEVRNCVTIFDNLPRPAFLGLLRDAAVLVGNSSSGIIEAASFGTPVIDVGPRQAGRERGENVTTVPFRQADIRRALAAIWSDGKPLRFPKKNPYGRGDTARRIARVLAGVDLSPRLRRKLIAY